MSDVNYDGILDDVMHELKRAHDEYPEPNPNFKALISEVGELAETRIDADRYNNDTYNEAIDVAVMAMRIAREELQKMDDDERFTPDGLDNVALP